MYYQQQTSGTFGVQYVRTTYGVCMYTKVHAWLYIKVATERPLRKHLFGRKLVGVIGTLRDNCVVFTSFGKKPHIIYLTVKIPLTYTNCNGAAL